MPRETRLVIGVVCGPHGVRGEARITSYLDDDLDLSGVEHIFLVPADGPPEQRRLIGSRVGPKGLILKIDGFDSPEEIAKIKGAKVEVDSDLLPPLEKDEYYWRDLIGLDVVTVEGVHVGTVKSIMPIGPQDLLAVDSGKGEVLIPAVEPIIVRVEIENRRIVIDPPEGLLEESG